MSGGGAGRLAAIWLKRAHRGVMDPVAEARLIEQKGLEGSVDRSRRRQVTLIERESWERALAELGARVDPSARRANLMVEGMALGRMRGRILCLGTARLLVGGEVTPCERMDEAHPGLRRALGEEWRGGVFAQVLTGGTIRVGDAVRWEDEIPLP